MVGNLAEGKPLRLPFFFVIPMVVGNLLQQSYSMVDSTMVECFVGEDALAAAGSSFPAVSLSVAIAARLPMGCIVATSQFFGAGRILKMKMTVSAALISLRVIELIIMGIREIIVGPLLALSGTDSDTVASSLAYLRTYFGGAVFLFSCNSSNGIYNALGDSQTPLKFLMVSVLTSIVLDLLSVIQFSMDVTGVAWTTLIVQGIRAVFPFFVLIARPRKMENERVAKGKSSAFLGISSTERVAKVGVFPMLQQFIVSTSMVLIQGLVNSHGKTSMVGYVAAVEIDALAMMPNMNFSNAMSDYATQSIGARRVDRAEQGYKASVFMAVVFSLIIISVVFLFGSWLLGLFPRQGAEGSAMSYGLGYMKTVPVFCILMGALLASNGLLQEAGDMGVFMFDLVVNLFFHVTITYLLAHFIGVSVIWWSISTGWAVGALLSFLRARSRE